MARIAESVTELIGRTPLVKLNRVAAGLPATVVAKLESQKRWNRVADQPCNAFFVRQKAKIIGKRL